MLRLLSCLLLLFTLLLPASNAHAELRDLPQLTILAPSSMTQVMTRIARDYSAEKSVTVTTSFDVAYEQAESISSGSPADVFITAHPQWMTDLKQKGSVDVYTITNLMRNSLCLTSSKNSNISARLATENLSITDLLQAVANRTLLVIGDPTYTSLGLYTLQTLKALKMDQLLLPHAIRAGTADHTVYLIANGNKAGITFCSNAYENPELNILAKFPENLHDPIIYQAAVVAGENMGLARDFIAYLKLPRVQKLFTKYGFVVE